MDEATIQQRIHELAAEERKQPLRWWYVSFADKQFRGVVVLMARGITDAARKCHKRGINPGGEVLAVPCTPETLPPAKYRNRLLTKADVLKAWPDAKSLKEWKAEDNNGQ